MRRTVGIMVVVLGVLLLFGSVALAATPQDIYNDYADNGELDGTYTEAEYQAYLDDATIHQYGDQAVLDALDDEVEAILAQDATGDRDEFPFTGFEIVLALLAAVVMVGVGVVLRRSAQ